MILEVKTYPAKILKTVSKDISVEKIKSEKIQTLIDNMIETLEHQGGVGLAAIQVGVPIRLFIVQYYPENDETKQLVTTFYINPVISRGDGNEEMEEGCLSIPDETAIVQRYAKVDISAYDRYGNYFEGTHEGLFARILQHENDHLDGKLFIEKVSQYSRDSIRKSIKARIKESEYVINE